MSPKQQNRLLAYEMLREQEESELAEAMANLNAYKG